MANSDGQVRIDIVTNAQQAAKDLNSCETALDKNIKTVEKAKTPYQSLEDGIRKNIEQLKNLALYSDGSSKQFKKLAEDTKNWQKALDDANKRVDKALGGIGKMSFAGINLSTVLKGISFVAIAKGLYDLGQQALATAADFEQLETSFKIMAGGAEQGQRLTNSLVELASKTPMTTKDLAQATQTLLAFGESSENVIEDLKLLGDISGGQAQRFQSLALAFAQVGSTGRLTGQDMMQMVNQGFNPLQIMAEKTGKSMATLKKEMGEGKISFDMVKEAMIDATSKGGRFYGLMEEQSQTLNGKISTLSDSWSRLMKIIGDDLLPLAKVAVGATDKVIQSIIDLNTWLRSQESSLTSLINKWHKYWASTRKAPADAMVFTAEPFKQSRETVTTASNVKKPKTGFSAGSGGDAGKSSKSTQKAKDAYEKLQAAVAAARREVELAAVAHGTSSEAVQKAFVKYRDLNAKLSEINKLFDDEKKKNQGKSEAYAALNEKITETTEKLRELYLTEGQSEAFNKTKNELVAMQTQLQDMNTAITSKIGLDWENVTNSIKSDLTSALVTPLKQGETAFERLQKIGLTAVQLIGQEIIKNLLEELTIQKAIAAVKTFGKAIGSFFGFGFADGAAFKNGNVIPFARGGVVNKPTLFPMANGGTGLMGEAGAEAVMPLRRMSNGRLGVEADTNESGQVVNIYNYSGASVETRKKDDNSLDVFIRKVNDALANERTSSGFRSAYSREDKRGVQAV